MKIVVNRLSALFITVFLVVGNAILVEQTLDIYGIRGHRLLTGVVGTPSGHPILRLLHEKEEKAL